MDAYLLFLLPHLPLCFSMFINSDNVEFINSSRKISRDFCARTINETFSNNENKKHRDVIQK